jgi:hypothetical protein
VATGARINRAPSYGIGQRGSTAIDETAIDETGEKGDYENAVASRIQGTSANPMHQPVATASVLREAV